MTSSIGSAGGMGGRQERKRISGAVESLRESVHGQLFTVAYRLGKGQVTVVVGNQ